MISSFRFRARHAILLLAWPLALFASAGDKPLAVTPAPLVFAAQGEVASPYLIRRPAEHLALEVTLTSGRELLPAKLDELELARLALLAAAQAAGLEVRPLIGSVSQPDQYGGKSISSSLASVFGDGGQANARFLLMARLDASTESLLPVARRLHAVLQAVKLPKETTLRAGAQRLALAVPETAREELRALVKRELAADLATLPGAATQNAVLTLDGLDEPIRVTQVGEREVALWLPVKAVYGRP
jgi:hypothetical protein